MKIDVGTRVQYSRNFLRSTGMLTGNTPFAKGTVVGVSTLGTSFVLADIAWDKYRDELPARVNTFNLNILGRREAE